LHFVSRHIDPARLSVATYPYRLEIATQFTDLDIVGHLNNVAIARFYESARVRTNMRVFGENFVRPDNPLQFPEPVTVGNGIGHVGNSSFRMQQALFQHGACIGISDAVMVVTVGGKPSPIPAGQRAAMQALRMPPAPH
jgi:acyl-CoA thioester hydrolase